MFRSDDGGQLTADLVELVASIRGDTGVKVLQVGHHGATGVAELVDPIGEGVVGSHACGYHRRPVAVELVAQAGQFGAPPAFGHLELLERVLFPPERLDKGGHLITPVPGRVRRVRCP